MRRQLTAFAFLAAAGLAGASYALLPARIPREVIERAVTRAPDALDRAWALPAASSFGGKLAFQSNPSLCGPASLANVYRSLGEPAQTEEAVLAGTGRCWTGYCIFGLTLDELAEVARARSPRRVTVFRHLTPGEFAAHMHGSNDPTRRYIVNFKRDRIFGSGVGHHSPIGGYLQEEDLVLVLDVNPDFGPWLVQSSRLFEAVDTFDGEKKRGLLLIE